jgi:hypothetical protein
MSARAPNQLPNSAIRTRPSLRRHQTDPVIAGQSPVGCGRQGAQQRPGRLLATSGSGGCWARSACCLGAVGCCWVAHLRHEHPSRAPRLSGPSCRPMAVGAGRLRRARKLRGRRAVGSAGAGRRPSAGPGPITRRLPSAARASPGVCGRPSAGGAAVSPGGVPASESAGGRRPCPVACAAIPRWRRHRCPRARCPVSTGRRCDQMTSTQPDGYHAPGNPGHANATPR